MAAIPGNVARHAVIRDACRTAHGQSGAFEEAVSRLRQEYNECCKGWPVGQGLEFHVVLTVEKPACEHQPG